MKKLLSILAAVGLTATASTTVVACGSSKASSKDNSHSNDEDKNDKKVRIGDSAYDDAKKEFVADLEGDKIPNQEKTSWLRQMKEEASLNCCRYWSNHFCYRCGCCDGHKSFAYCLVSLIIIL